MKEQDHKEEHEDSNGMQVNRRKKDVGKNERERKVATHDEEKGKDKGMGGKSTKKERNKRYNHKKRNRIMM